MEEIDQFPDLPFMKVETFQVVFIAFMKTLKKMSSVSTVITELHTPLIYIYPSIWRYITLLLLEGVKWNKS